MVAIMKGLSGIALLLTLLPSAVTAVDWDSTAHEILLPTEAPELEEPDSWICPASNLTRFFDVPLPPPELYDAMMDYGEEYREQCTITGREALYGCYPSKEHWCQITTAAPPDALVDYMSYGNAASSWWKEHSSSALELASQCPDNWYNAMFDIPGGDAMLNLTIIFAACHVEALETTGSEIVRSTTSRASGTALPGGSETGQAAAVTPTPDPDSDSGGVVGRDATKGLWAVTGIAAAAAANVGF